MAAFQVMASLILILTLSTQGALGSFSCKDLPKEWCAFSISSKGTRCVLEKYVQGARVEYQCSSSEVMVEKMLGWIETDECIEACGLERNWVGISSDSLLESRFIQKLCSPQCYQGCPNIADLFFNLAAGEGVFLPKLCEAQNSNSRREMAEIQSSGLLGLMENSPTGSPIGYSFGHAQAPAPF